MAREYESRPIIRTHFIFLIHGFMGNPEELSYFKEAIEGAVVKSKNNIEDAIEGDIVDTVDNGDGDSSEIITHRVTCNENKTLDGIEAGGERVAQEVQNVVIDHFGKKQNHDVDQQPIQNDNDPGRFHASISFVGYSLGGMYARYAISVLPLELEFEFNSNKIILHPNCFVTAATPHLGMASHSYIAIPRFMEYLLGYGSGRTGRDLFRLHNRRTNHRGFIGNNTKKKENGDNATATVAIAPNDLVYRMATDETFLNPLSAFRQRVSYINAFDTDFMVPTATAGMLSSYSNTEQHLLSSEYDHWNPETIGFDVYAFETKPCNMPSSRRGIIQSTGTRSRRNDETLTMASSLDSLGWTKVFVDCRKGMHGPSVRCICRHPRKDLLHAAIDAKKKKKITSLDNREEATGENGVCFESKELCKLLKSSEHWHIAPTGHFVLVAHSKTERGAKNYAEGRPLVDQVALDLVNDVMEIR